MTFRATSRVLLFDEHDRTLLFLQYGKSRDVPPRWITPGGGVDPGEDHDRAALREVREETGLVLADAGRPFFAEDFAPDQRWHPYDTGHWEWYAARVNAFTPSREGWTESELSDVVDWRWFSVADLEASSEEYEPANLPDLLRSGLATLGSRPSAELGS